MEINYLTKTYNKQERDDSITPFQNEIGFSLVRKYPKNSKFHNDSLRMFIKVALLEEGLFYSVDMTKPETKGEKVDYIIKYPDKSAKYTNFFSDSGEPEFVFDKQSLKIIHIKKNKEFTLNQFIDILEKNHMSDCLFFKRKFNWCVDVILRLLFWMSDRHYDKVKTSLDKYYFKKEGKTVLELEKNTEPFFKYFNISKNFIFLILLLVFIFVIILQVFQLYDSVKCLWKIIFGDFTLSNPFVVLLFFLTLFTSEKISSNLNKNINDFLMPDNNVFAKPKENFIEKLHNYLHRNKFNLKV